MRRLWISIVLAGLLIAALGVTVFSQVVRPTAQSDEVRILQGGVSHQVPVSVTLIVPTESGIQTVTVPLLLNLNLTVGPLNAIDLAVDVPAPTQFVSPITAITPVTTTSAVTTSSTTTGTQP
jgi:hypothetical protein